MSLDFKIYKPLRQEAMEQAGVQNETEFVQKFADSISKSAGVPVTGSFEGEGEQGFVHLHAEREEDIADIGFALEDLGLSFGV